MRRALPHLQIDQLPPPEFVEQLAARCLKIPCVRSKHSRMALPGSHALYLADACAAGPPEAFIDAHEFCHLQPLPEGSIHLTLPRMLGYEVVRLGWGELHPISVIGILPTLLTVYAPRDYEEMNVVFGLVGQSCLFARGKLRDLDGEERFLREAQ